MNDKTIPMREQTLIMLKPSEALRRVGTLRKQLSKCGHITEARMVTLTTEAVEILTAHLSPHPLIQQETRKHYVGKILPVIVLQGEGVIWRVSQLVGTHANPEKCAEGTIRHTLWKEFGCSREYVGDSVYYNNFIMCSRTEGEAVLYIRTLINPNLVSFRF